MTATPAWPPRSAPRLFVTGRLEQCQGRGIDGPAAHYLANVMRVKPGQQVILLDDISGEWVAEVEQVQKRHVLLTVLGKLRDRLPVPDLWLCVAPIRKPRFELVAEKATELGVRRIVPVLTRRSVVDKVNGDRLRAVVTEAAEQCARTSLPETVDPLPLPRLLREWPAERRLFFADEMLAGGKGQAAASAFAAHPGPAALLIGPEGGFDDDERALLHRHDAAHAVALGPRILRAETAAIAALSLWMATAGDWGA